MLPTGTDDRPGNQRPSLDRNASLRAALVPLLGLVALGLLHLAPLSLFPTTRAATHSPDVQENMWRLLWGLHALVSDPLEFMNANAFFPDEGTYATMDYMVSLSILAAPFRLATADPLTVYNLTAIASIALSAWGAYLLTRALTGNPAAAFIGAAIFALNPVHTSRLGQLNVLAIHGLPFVLLAVHRLYQRVSGKRMAFLAAALLLAITTSGYQAVFASLAMAWATLVLTVSRPRERWRAATATLAAIGIAAVLFAPLAWPYVTAATEKNRVRTIGDVHRGSPQPISLVLLESTLHDRLRGPWDPNGSLLDGAGAASFPGVLVIVLGLIGLVHWGARPDRRELALLYGGLAVAGFALSVGLHLPGYAQLYSWLPPIRMVRAPSRFSLVGLIGLAVLAAAGIGWILERLRHRRRTALTWALVSVVCLLHLVETWKPVGVPSELRYTPPPAVYGWLASQPGNFGVVELPTDPEQNTTALVYSTFHWKPLVNGYHGSFVSGYHHRLLFEVLPEFPSDNTVRTLSSIVGLRYIVVHVNPEPDHFRLKGRFHRRRQLTQALKNLPPTLRIVWRSKEDAVVAIVDPPEGWTGLEVERVAGSAALRGRTLAFEARAIAPSIAPLDNAELVVKLDDREIGRATVRETFRGGEFQLPADGIAPGMHTLRIRVQSSVDPVRLSAYPEFRIGQTGVAVPAWIRVITEDPGTGEQVRIFVNGQPEAPAHLGYSIVVMDPTTARVIDRAHFAVRRNENEQDRLAAVLEALPKGTVVAAASAGFLGDSCNDRLAAALRSVGSARNPCVTPLRTHAFVGVKGSPPGSASEAGSRASRSTVEIGSEAILPRVAVRRVVVRRTFPTDS